MTRRHGRRSTVWALGVGSAVLLSPSAGAVPGWAQGSESGTAQEGRASQWWLEGLGVSAAQEVTRGEGVVVCVIDSGVQVGLEVFEGTRFEPGTDFSGTSEDGLAVVAGNPHGTAMTALIAGQGEGPGDAEGTLGVAPEVTVISVAAELNVRFPSAEESTFHPAVKECADRGADVINMSVIGPLSMDAVAYAQARDVVIVAGTGNSGLTGRGGSGLASVFGVVGVGGVNQSLQRDPQSNVGGADILYPDEPDFEFASAGMAVMGPSSVGGWDDPDCDGMFVPALDPPGGYQEECGTSGATAITTGVVALIRAHYPQLNAANVINRLLRTAKPPTDGSAVPSEVYGFGVIDAEAALTDDVPLVEHNPLGSSYTRSMGVWNTVLKPEHPEPPAGTELDPAPLGEPIIVPGQDSDTDTTADDSTTRTTDPDDTRSTADTDTAATDTTGNTAGVAGPDGDDADPAAGTDQGAGVPWGWIIPAGAALLVAGAAVAAWLFTRRTRRRDQRVEPTPSSTSSTSGGE